MWTERHSQNKNTVQTHDDFYSRKNQRCGGNKTYALISDEAFSVFLSLPALKWARLPLQYPLLGPVEASASHLGCSSGAYLKVSMGSLCGSCSLSSICREKQAFLKVLP